MQLRFEDEDTDVLLVARVCSQAQHSSRYARQVQSPQSLCCANASAHRRRSRPAVTGQTVHAHACRFKLRDSTSHCLQAVCLLRYILLYTPCTNTCILHVKMPTYSMFKYLNTGNQVLVLGTRNLSLLRHALPELLVLVDFRRGILRQGRGIALLRRMLGILLHRHMHPALHPHPTNNTPMCVRTSSPGGTRTASVPAMFAASHLSESHLFLD